ncbi:MAG: TolC family protein [Bacteroidaceae bacterium]|nr:TolC family protein [Bacteroidaceae bacterium]
MIEKLFFRKKWLMLLAALPFAAAGAQEAEQPVEGTLELDLNKAIEIALAENPTMRIAEDDIELKKVADKAAWQNLLPQADLSASYSHNFKIQTIVMGGQSFKMGTENTSNAGLSISLPVFAPAVYRTMKMTKDDIKLAEEQARSSKLDLVNQVTKAYYQLILAQDSYKVLQKSYKQAEDNYKITSAKFDQGSVSEYDKITAEVQMRNILPNVVSAENAVRMAKLQLKVLMGVTANVDLLVTDKLENYQDEVFANLSTNEENDLSNNTSLKQLDLNQKLLQHQLRIQKASFLPTLAFTFNWSYTSMANDYRIFHYRWNPYVYGAFSLSIPLYHASNFTNLKTTRLNMQKLAENRLNTERQLNMQATTYRQNMHASTEQVVSNREAMAQAQKARDISDKRYQVGSGTMLELNSSEVALTQAELTYCQSIYDFMTAKADLDKVLGKSENF